jgi:hypothetical protein
VQSIEDGMIGRIVMGNSCSPALESATETPLCGFVVTKQEKQ